MVYNWYRIVVIKMRKVLKTTIILIMMLMVQMNFNMVFADEESLTGTERHEQLTQDGEVVENIFGKDTFLSTFDPFDGQEKPGTEYENKLNKILGTIQVLGTFIAVGALMAIGIKFMLASVEEKSLLKQAMPGYVTGAIMVFAITWLPKLIYDLTQAFN